MTSRLQCIVGDCGVSNSKIIFREWILVWTPQVGSDARIYQLEGRSLENCLSWLRSHKGCLKHDLFLLEYSRSASL